MKDIKSSGTPVAADPAAAKKKKIQLIVAGAIGAVLCVGLALKDNSRAKAGSDEKGLLPTADEMRASGEDVEESVETALGDDGDPLLTPDQMSDVMEKRKRELAAKMNKGVVGGLSSEEMLQQANSGNREALGLRGEPEPEPAAAVEAPSPVARAKALAEASDPMMASDPDEEIALPTKPTNTGTGIPDGMDSEEFGVLVDLAKGGDGGAELELATAYLNSKKDGHLLEGVTRLQHAADLGSTKAMVELARRKRDGDGMPRDNGGAYALLTVAQAVGYTGAESERLETTKLMSERDLTLAHARAGEVLRSMTKEARDAAKKSANRLNKEQERTKDGKKTS